jgi:hypothetical protein
MENIQSKLFCAFIWFKSIEKMVLQMKSGFLQLKSPMSKVDSGCINPLITCNSIFSIFLNQIKGAENHSLD